MRPGKVVLLVLLGLLVFGVALPSATTALGPSTCVPNGGSVRVCIDGVDGNWCVYGVGSPKCV